MTRCDLTKPTRRMRTIAMSSPIQNQAAFGLGVSIV